MRSAPTTFPAAIDTGKLPLVLTFPMSGEMTEEAQSMYRVTRRYEVELYVRASGTGKPVDEGIQECIPFLDRFLAAYYADQTLGGNVELVVWPITDSGIVLGAPLRVPNFWGIQFQITTREKV